jgi:hypothetical protein
MELSNHHAYLLRTDTHSIAEVLKDIISDRSGPVLHLPFTNIVLADVGAIRHEAARRPETGNSRLLLVSAKSISFESQQALLKLLEEPPDGTQFLFVLPSQAVLLATVQSRFFELPPGSSHETVGEDWHNFMAQAYPDRLTTITKKLAKKDLDWITAMQLGVRQFTASSTFPQATLRDLETLSLISSYLGSRGASNKQLLELLALHLPVMQNN